MKSKGTVANNLVKPPYTSIDYTPVQLSEFMACCDPVTGPEYFLRNFFYIQSEETGRQLFTLYDYQLDLLDAYHNNRFSCAMVSRQMGKCLSEKVNIRIRNKKTGEIREIPIGDFHAMQKDSARGTT